MALPDWSIYLMVIIGSYLVGSMPTGWILGKLTKKIDIRNYGSGNTGFSNVYRLLGKGPAILTLIGDVFVKGFVLIIGIRLLIGYVIIKQPPESFFDVYRFGYIEIVPQIIIMISGIVAICGHNWPVWLNFKGGKGFATTAGVFMCLVPLAAAFLTIVWFIIVKTTGYTSLSNISTAPTLPIFIFLEAYFVMNLKTGLLWLPLILCGLAAGLLVLWSHRENILRLRSGTERRFGDRSERIE